MSFPRYSLCLPDIEKNENSWFCTLKILAIIALDIVFLNIYFALHIYGKFYLLSMYYMQHSFSLELTTYELAASTLVNY
jgi:hypothetical protein